MGVLGLGRRNLRPVGLDDARRADLRQMEAFIREDLAAGRTPMAIVGNAGDVNIELADRLDMDDGAIRTSAAVGLGGNVTIDSPRYQGPRYRDGSDGPLTCCGRPLCQFLET